MAKTPTGKAERKPSPRKVPDADGVRRNATYSLKLVGRICAHLGDGLSLQSVSKQPGMPSYSTLHNWRKQWAGFAEAIAIAREAAVESCLDRALEVARAATKESVTRDRLEVNTWENRAKHHEKEAAKAAPAQDKPEPVKIVFYARHFERVIGEDGKAFVREIPLPEDPS